MPSHKRREGPVVSVVVDRRKEFANRSDAIDEALFLHSIISESLTAETNDGAWGKLREAPRWLPETWTTS